MSQIQLLSKPKTKRGSTYLFPCICFGCRKTFRKPPSETPRPCPDCSKPMIMLNRKFSSPKSRDVEQWKKVDYLVQHGFYFFSVYRTAENGKKISVPYPARLADAPSFVKEFMGQSARHRRAAEEPEGRSQTSSPSDA